jgi:hypothetical protein
MHSETFTKSAPKDSLINSKPVQSNPSSFAVVLDDQGSVYTWGFGAYGRLGHKTPKDEWKPRKVDFFSNRMAVPPGSLITAGGAFSGCTAGACFPDSVFFPLPFCLFFEF